ncbi:MAG: TetR family transcriptional regulator [Alphaproteobacteria bacterium]|jgi:AcrR family transcriptional regulator|nr:TetR family transcriptional regulator [Alphaproteobacteria bacterium]
MARRTNAERTAETKASLIAAARRLFAAQGYAATSTDEILAAAGVTRGALYHHYKEKAELFADVCLAMHDEASVAIVAAADATKDPLISLERGCEAWMDYMARAEARRILVLDAPSVLGWARWNEMDAQGFAHLTDGVREAMAAGKLQTMPAEELAVLLNGAMNFGVMWAGQARDAARLHRIKAAVKRLFKVLRA